MNRRTSSCACLSMRSLLLIVAGVLLITAAADDTNSNTSTNSNSNAGECLNPDAEQKFETAAVQSCRSRPTWRRPSSSEDKDEEGDQFGDRCRALFGYYPDPEKLIAGKHIELSSVYDFKAQTTDDEHEHDDEDKYYKDYDSLPVMERPLVQRLMACVEERILQVPESSKLLAMPRASIARMHRRRSDGRVVLAEIENALVESEAKSVTGLSECLQELVPDDLFEIRDFGSGGGNDVTYMAGFLQLILPGVAAQLRNIVSEVWQAARWGDIPETVVPADNRYRGNEPSRFSTHKYPDPRTDSFLRTTEFLSYDRFGSLGIHQDAGSDYTIVVSLSDPNDYEGGAFSIFPDHDEQQHGIVMEATRVTVKPSRLSAVVFLSKTDHRVEPIHSAGRVTFANEFWRYGEVPIMVLRPKPKQILLGDPNNHFYYEGQEEDDDDDDDGYQAIE